MTTAVGRDFKKGRRYLQVTNHVSICIATYKRLQMLERLLRKLARQNTNSNFHVSIFVVDNDAKGSAKSTAYKIRNECNLDLEYSIEPIRSIAAVRNHALRRSKGNYIAIIDDDEIPPVDWLLNLFNTIQTFDVDGALGPVHPFFDSPPPEWLIKGKFCERPVLRTGTLLKWHQTRTGNVLLKREVFDEYNIRFDEKFKTGGSDQAFFKKAIEKGYRFVACAEAPVYEVVPAERWKKSYYINRALVNGFNAHKYFNSLSTFFALIKSTVALIIYVLLLPFSLLVGTHRVMQCLEKGSYHLSRVLATFGIEVLKRRNF